MKFILIFALVCCAAPGFGKTLNRCSLAKQMHKLGVPKYELARWTCIAERQSSYRTDLVGPTGSNGSNDYGIFQINSAYWCNPRNGKSSHNKCKVNCKSLLSNNIEKSVRCAQQIKNQQGFEAWGAWQSCKGSLPSIDSCF